MSTPSDKIFPRINPRQLKKIQNDMPAPTDIFNRDLSWVCTKGGRYEFLDPSSNILEYQLGKDKSIFGTLTLEKRNHNSSSSSSSSPSILITLRIHTDVMHPQIIQQLNNYADYIADYEDLLNKKTNILRIVTDNFSSETKKIFERLGVAEELSLLVSDTIAHFQPKRPAQAKRKYSDSNSSVNSHSSVSSSNPNSPSAFSNSSSTHTSPSTHSSISFSLNLNSGSSITSDDNSPSGISTTVGKFKRRNTKTSAEINQRAKNIMVHFKDEETTKQISEQQEQPPLLYLRNVNPNDIPKQPPEETYSIIEGSYEAFKENTEVALTFQRSKPDNGIHQLILSKSIDRNVFLQSNPPKIVFSIKILLDRSKPNLVQMENNYREMLKLEDYKIGNQKIPLFHKVMDGCLQSRTLKQEHFIFLLGKLMLPDDITSQLHEITRTYSDCYNLTQTPTSQLSRQNSDITVILSQPKSSSNSSESTEVLSQDNNQTKKRSKSLTKS